MTNLNQSFHDGGVSAYHGQVGALSSNQLPKESPTTLSSFNVPNMICDKMDALTQKNWWKPNEKEGKFLAWKAWDKLCQPVRNGSLGFKKAKDFNNALLAKLTWMMASRDSLCMQILRSKYKVKFDWLYKNQSKMASPIWKAIEKKPRKLSSRVLAIS